jgi:hypothetical protein
VARLCFWPSSQVRTASVLGSGALSYSSPSEPHLVSPMSRQSPGESSQPTPSAVGPTSTSTFALASNNNNNSTSNGASFQPSSATAPPAQPTVATRASSRHYATGIAAGAEDVMYKGKYKELKKKVREVELVSVQTMYYALQDRLAQECLPACLLLLLVRLSTCLAHRLWVMVRLVLNRIMTSYTTRSWLRREASSV